MPRIGAVDTSPTQIYAARDPSRSDVIAEERPNRPVMGCLGGECVGHTGCVCRKPYVPDSVANPYQSVAGALCTPRIAHSGSRGLNVVFSANCVLLCAQRQLPCALPPRLNLPLPHARRQR